MKLSTKGRYAVTALADMAVRDDGRGVPVTLADISQRQDISVAYLEQLFLKLRKAGLVKSIRGPRGGYILAKVPQAMNIAEIMFAVDETVRASKCEGVGGDGCAHGREHCLAHDLWEELSAHVHVFLMSRTLKDVIEKRLKPCPAVPDFLNFPVYLP